MTSPRDADGEPRDEPGASPGLTWGENGERSNEGPDDDSRGTRGLRWGGDGALRPRQAAPEDHPASPAHRTRRELEEPATDAGPLGQPYASFVRRTGGWLIDTIFKILLLEIVFAVTGLATVADPFATQVLLTGQLVSRGYDWFFWSRGWTPGARVLGMRIVLADGSVPGIGPGLLRTLGSVLSEVALLIGYVWMLWDGKRQTWHDKIGGTYVIMAPEEE